MPAIKILWNIDSFALTEWWFERFTTPARECEFGSILPYPGEMRSPAMETVHLAMWLSAWRRAAPGDARVS